MEVRYGTCTIWKKQPRRQCIEKRQPGIRGVQTKNHWRRERGFVKGNKTHLYRGSKKQENGWGGTGGGGLTWKEESRRNVTTWF